MSEVNEQFLGPFAGHIGPTEAEREDNLLAAARDMPSVVGLDGRRRLRSGRTYGGTAREVPAAGSAVPSAGLFMDDGIALSGWL